MEEKPRIVNFDYDDVSQLVGRLLTYADATYLDLEQRRAHKSLIKQICYNWYYDKWDALYPDDKSLRGIPVEK